MWYVMFTEYKLHIEISMQLSVADRVTIFYYIDYLNQNTYVIQYQSVSLR